MRAIGVVRKTDSLGRIVIPNELRRKMNIDIGDPIEIFVDEDQVILKQYRVKKECLITGDVSDQNLSLANGKAFLSREGAELLKKELEEYLKKVY